MGILTEELIYGLIRDAKPTFRNAEDRIVFTVHAAFVASGFHLHATAPHAFDNYYFTSSSLEEATIENWNIYDSFYAFIYFNPGQGSKKIDVKAVVMPGKLFFSAFSDGDSEPHRLQINIDDYALEKEENYHYLKNFEKLVGCIEKQLVNKYGGTYATTTCDTKPRGSKGDAPRGGSEGDVYPDSDIDVHPDLKRLRGDSGCDVYPDLKRLKEDNGGDAHPDLKRLRGGSSGDVQPDLKRFRHDLDTF